MARPVLQLLIVLFVTPRFDYGNATLAGLPDNQLNRLQSMLNAAARLVFLSEKVRSRQSADPRPTASSSWRYCCLHSTAPPYLADELYRSSGGHSLVTAPEVGVYVYTRRATNAPIHY